MKQDSRSVKICTWASRQHERGSNDEENYRSDGVDQGNAQGFQINLDVFIFRLPDWNCRLNRSDSANVVTSYI